MKHVCTSIFLSCAIITTSLSFGFQESIRQQQERQMYAPHLSAPTSIGQQQVNAMIIHQATSAVRPTQPQAPAQQKR